MAQLLTDEKRTPNKRALVPRLTSIFSLAEQRGSPLQLCEHDGGCGSQSDTRTAGSDRQKGHTTLGCNQSKSQQTHGWVSAKIQRGR